ncbi:MAG: pyrimidine 5'-nucleotidase [Kiloniellales bacterium]
MPSPDSSVPSHRARRPRLDGDEVWIFDLDNTLYPASCGLFPQIDRRMGEFIEGFLSLGRDEARRLQKRYFQEHGTTLRGLMLNHALRAQDYLDFVHAVDLSAIAPSAALDAALESLPGRKLVFTNASTAHAERVLTRLGIARHFQAVFDIAAADYRPKPMAEPYHRLVARHAIEPQRAVFFEDSARNLEPAAALGMTTVLVAAADEPTGDAVADFVHHVTADLAGWLRSLVTAPAKGG